MTTTQTPGPADDHKAAGPGATTDLCSGCLHALATQWDEWAAAALALAAQMRAEGRLADAAHQAGQAAGKSDAAVQLREALADMENP